MLVPFPRAASRRLISFLTFQISMFFSASLGCCSFDDMVAVWLLVWCVCCRWWGSRVFLTSEGQERETRVADLRREMREACYAAVYSAPCSLFEGSEGGSVSLLACVNFFVYSVGGSDSGKATPSRTQPFACTAIQRAAGMTMLQTPGHRPCTHSVPMTMAAGLPSLVMASSCFST